MDSDSPTRTFWTVWYYITGAVNRFFRPELTNISSNDPNSIQETSVDSEPANFGPTEGDASERGVDKEQPLAAALQLSSSRPVVAWELCTTDIDLGGDEESMQYKTQLSRGSQRKASENSEGTREEQCPQVGNDEAGLLVAKEDKQEETGDQKLSTGGRDETPDNGAYEEHANTRSFKLTDDAISEDMEESGWKAGAKEETKRAMTTEDPQKMGQTMRNMEVKEAESKMQHGDEKDLQAEDIKVKLCPITDLSGEEEDNVHIEEAKMQKNEAHFTVTHEEVENSDGVPELACKNENNSDEGAGLLVAKEDKQEETGDQKLSTGGRDETPDNGAYEEHANTRSFKLTDDAISEDMEESGWKAGAKEETKRAMTTEDPQKMGQTMRNMEVKEAESKMQHGDEKDLQAEDIKVKLCPITDLSGEEEDNVHIEEAKMQKNETHFTVTHEEVENSDGVPELACKNENNSDEGAGLLVAKEDKQEETGDQKLSTGGRDETPDNGAYEEHANTRSFKLTDDAISEDMEESGWKAGAKEETKRAMTTEDPQKMGQTMRNMEVKEAESKMQHGDEKDLQAEDIKVKLCPITDLSGEEEDNVHIEEAKMQRNEAHFAVTHEEVENSDGVPELACKNESNSDEGAGLLVAKEDKQEETGDQKLSTGGRDETPDNGAYEEHANTRSFKLTDDAISEDMEESGREAGAEEENMRAMTTEDPQKMGQTMRNMEVKEAESKMQHGDEKDLQAEDIKVKLCPFTDLSGEEEDNVHIEEAKMQKNEAHFTVTHEEVENSDGVPELACKNENNSDEGAGLLVAKEDKQEETGDQKLSTGGRDETPDNGAYEEHANTRSFKLTDDAISEDMEESGWKAGAKEETKRAMTTEDPQKMGQTMRNMEVKEAESKMQHGDEKDLQAEDIKVKLCPITDLSGEEEDNVHIEEAKMQKNETHFTVTHEEVENSDGVPELACKNENNSDEGAGLLVAKEDKQEETGDQKLSTGGRDETPDNGAYEEHANTRSFKLTDDAISEDMEESGWKAGAKEETKRAMTTEDPQKMGQTMRNMEVKEAESKMQHGDEKDLQAEDIKVKLCPITDLSGEEEDNVHIEEAKMQRNEAHFAVTHEEVENSDGVPELACKNESNSDEGAGLLVAKEDKQEETGDQKLSTGGRDETPDNGAYEEHANTRSFKLTDDAISEDMEESGREAGAEEENMRAMTTEDPQKMGQTMRNMEVKEAESKMQHGDEKDLQAEDIKVKLCPFTDLSGEEEDNVHIEEAKMQKNEAHFTVTHEEVENSDGVPELACKNENNSDEGAGLLVAKEDKQEETGDQKLSTGGRDETPDNGAYEEHANTRSFKLTDDAISEDMEESGWKAGAKEETKRAMTTEDPQKMGQTMRNMEVKEAESKMQHGDEKDLQAEDIKVKLCPITDLSGEEEDNVHIEEAKMQKNETHFTVTHEEVENSDGVPELACKNENNSDKGAKLFENQLSVCEQLSDNNRDFKADPGLTSLHVELQMAHDKSGIESEDESFVVEQEHVMAHRSESDNMEEEEEEEEEEEDEEDEQDEDEEDEQDEDEEGAVVEEENMNEDANNQTIVDEQEDTVKTVAEEEDILTERVTHSEEVLQNAKTELHTAEFPDAEQVDVAEDADVQTKTREVDDKTESHSMVINGKSDVTTTHISVDEGLFDQDQVEEERLFSEVGNDESFKEIAGTMTSVAVKPEGETGQEMSGEFKNIPLGICEGQVVVSQELNFPTCEETQEGVPEYNNVPGPDENTTQRFLEEGDCKEIQGSKLPEEVESKEPESLQNSGCRTGADYLPTTEQMEEEQESTRDVKNSVDAGLPRETEKPLVEAVTQESGHLFEEEEGEFLADSMKTGIEHSEKEFESDIGLTDEIHKPAKEPQDGSEEILIEYEIDEGLCDSKVADAAGGGSETTGALTAEETFLKAEGQKMTETSFFQESVDALSSEQNSNTTSSLLEDISESGFLKQYDETEPKLLEDVEIQVSGQDVEETGYEVEEVASEDEMQSKTEIDILHPRVVGLPESELSLPVGSLETRKQQSDEALEISDEMLTDSEAADKSRTAESKPKDFTMILREEVAKHATESEGSCAEETVCSFSGSQDVIDKEILNLRLQTALSEDNDGIKQQVGPQPVQQMEPSNEEQGEISSMQTEKDKEQLVESNSRESELVSDTEMSSSTVESGFLDQSLCEWGTQTSESQLLISTSTGSFQGIYDTLAIVSESADISELSTQQPNSESQDILMDEVAETGQSYLKEEESTAETGFHPDSGVPSPEPRYLNQESNKSPEKKVESVETETGSQKEIDVEVSDWKDTEEADAKSLTEMSSLLKVEETKAEDESLEMTVSDIPDEIKPTESGRSRFGSEGLFEDEIVLTESGSQDNTCPESERKLPSEDKPQLWWSEDVAESLLGLNRADVPGQPTTKSEDQMEVDSSALDFTAQKSRIFVKNPRVRPPKDPRSLLHMPSLDPTPSPHLSAKVPAGVLLGGLGFGVKLPGLGAGFPVLKKTRVVRDENSPDALSQESKPEERSDTHTQDEAQRKPKWMPPRHPGFGNPLMSELKTKLKKTTKE